MNGPSFVRAVAAWLLLLVLAGTLLTVAVTEQATWALVLMFALVWVPLTMRWAWSMFKDNK